MPPVAATQVRAGRAAALFAKFQIALGTAANSFGASDRLWQDEAEIDQGPRVNEPRRGMENSRGPDSATTYVLPDRPAGQVLVKATPSSLRAVLDSNFGAFSGTAWALASQVSDARWTTLALLENVAGGTYKVVRIRDAWFHKVAIVAAPGPLMLRAEYAGWKELNEAANAGGVTLPAAPAQPSDEKIFPFSKITLTRDPASANVGIRFSRLSVTLDQQLSHRHGMATGLWEASKKGPLVATIDLEADFSDETWTLLSNALAGTKQRYQMKAITDAVAPQTFTIDLYDCIWNVAPVGHRGKEYHRIRATAIARVDALGNFISVSLA